MFFFFSVELKKQSSCSIHLINKSSEYVAFKVSASCFFIACVLFIMQVLIQRGAPGVLNSALLFKLPLENLCACKSFVIVLGQLPGIRYNSLALSFCCLHNYLLNCLCQSILVANALLNFCSQLCSFFSLLSLIMKVPFLLKIFPSLSTYVHGRKCGLMILKTFRISYYHGMLILHSSSAII